MMEKWRLLKDEMIDVTAAIIEREGKYLIARRKKRTHLEGKWGFPGGKVKKDETPEKCLRRELGEEFGIDSIVGNLFGESVYDYGNKEIRLISYDVIYISGDFVLNAHDKINWVYPKELGDYDFAEADKPFVKKLMNL